MLFNPGWDGVRIDEPILEKSTDSTGKEATEFELCRYSPEWRVNQHGDNVLLFRLFDPADSDWLGETREHIEDIFTNGYNSDLNDTTPLGALIGAHCSGMVFEGGKVTAFDVCFKPPITSTTEQAKWWLLDRMATDGVLTPTVAYSHDKSFWHTDRQGQVSIRATDCSLDGVALARWLLDMWRDYRHAHVRQSRLSRHTAVSGRSRGLND